LSSREERAAYRNHDLWTTRSTTPPIADFLTHMAWMYILRCADDSHYVGSTRNLDGRLWQHQNGEAADYTRHRLPVELVYACACENVGQAFWLEKRVQGWSRRKREALIRGDFDALPGLAKKDFGKRSRPE
jgi:putative endonuclease